MKKTVSVMLSIVFAVAFAPFKAAAADAQAPSVSAEAYVLYCADNGRIICSQNENKKNEACKHHQDYDLSDCA